MDPKHDYAGDEWLRGTSSRETQLKRFEGQMTRGIAKRPRLEKPPWSDGETVAGFRLGKVIGFGSQGWVYAAVEVATGADYALKFMPIVNQKESVRAKTGFRRMSKLRHRGLVRLHRIHHAEDWLGFSMEIIRGRNLVHVFRSWTSLPLDEACRRLTEMIRQVGAALAWIHAHQLVHRDIKPTNLMLTEDDERFVIIDCDLTGKLETENDPDNIRSYLIWTPMYVAPEVLYRQSYCPASDIFSLGMVVLEALRLFTAHHCETLSSASDPIHRGDDPFDDVIPRDDEDLEIDRGHITNAITGLAESIPELLRETVAEMLSPDVSDRPTAMSLSRLGQPIAMTAPIATIHNNESVRAIRITQTARQNELIEFRRWTHLVLGGKVQRLHVEGASGAGKSTFLEVALSALRQQSWPLVLTARCQRFEQRPLQAFSQIADEIIMRYRSGRFEKLAVDSVSESILQRSLPGLSEVLEVDWSESPVVTSPSRPGGLEAAMKICNQLRRSGPLFMVVDDVQWADQDTLHVLDHLQSTIDHRIGPPQYQGMGLITISRSNGDRQQHRPHTMISLGPISSDVTRQAIREEMVQQGVDLTEQQIEEINDQIEGQPYRLQVYLSELSPAGLLYGDVGVASTATHSTPTIPEVWQHRSDNLEAKVRHLLDMIVIAGRQTTFDELRLIQGIGTPEMLETMLDELAEKRLIVRDGSDGQLLSIWHDQLRRQLLAPVSRDRQIQMHEQWGEGLAMQIETPSTDNLDPSRSMSPKSAGRIAEHFEKADKKDLFLHWAQIAAGQAQHLYAHNEAARWYRIVAEHSHGAERTSALQMAAETLQRSGQLHEAALVYFELSERLTGQAKLESELEYVHCFIRSGRFHEVIDRLQPLLIRLKLPRRKSVWVTKLSLGWRIVCHQAREKFVDRIGTPKSKTRTTLHANQIAACLRLIRPLSYIDNWLAAELSLYCGELVKQVGKKSEQIEILAGECVFRSYRPGPARLRAARLLDQLDAKLDPNDNPSLRGDVQAGKAWAAGMTGKFVDVPKFVRESREAYLASEYYHGFEIAHTSYVESIAYFQLGDLLSLTKLVDNMQTESATTNDRFVFAMGSLGFASTAFLIRDDCDGLQKAHDALAENLTQIGADGFALVAQIKSLLTAIYQNRISELPRLIRQTETEVREAVTYHRVQILQVLVDELIAIATLPWLASGNSSHKRQFQRYIKRLRRQRLDVASVYADLLEGVALARYPKTFSNDVSTSHSRADRLLKQAVAGAQAQSLLPASLAARDELDRLAGNDQPQRLIRFLEAEGVKKPAAFARLYGG